MSKVSKDFQVCIKIKTMTIAEEYWKIYEFFVLC